MAKPKSIQRHINIAKAKKKYKPKKINQDIKSSAQFREELGYYVNLSSMNFGAIHEKMLNKFAMILISMSSWVMSMRFIYHDSRFFFYRQSRIKSIGLEIDGQPFDKTKKIPATQGSVRVINVQQITGQEQGPIPKIWVEPWPHTDLATFKRFAITRKRVIPPPTDLDLEILKEYRKNPDGTEWEENKKMGVIVVYDTSPEYNTGFAPPRKIRSIEINGVGGTWSAAGILTKHRKQLGENERIANAHELLKTEKNPYYTPEGQRALRDEKKRTFDRLAASEIIEDEHGMEVDEKMQEEAEKQWTEEMLEAIGVLQSMGPLEIKEFLEKYKV